MRIPYLTIPCLFNETCFHGQCVYAEDFLIGWYEFCLCHREYSGYECNEQTKLNQTDWWIISSWIIAGLTTCLCLVCLPYFYSFLKEDFYPQIIECTRSTPYVEVSSTDSIGLIGQRVYRIPSEHLARRRTIIDGLRPLHSISSLAYVNRFRTMRAQRRNELIHTP